MPIYEFECACGREQELLLRMRDPDPACPECRKPMRRKISKPNFSLKGDGWAKDNYGIKPPVPKPSES